MQCFRQMNIILSVGLKGNAAKLHRWFSRSHKKLIEMWGFFVVFYYFCAMLLQSTGGVDKKRIFREVK